jgi:hypothetical protein
LRSMNVSSKIILNVSLLFLTALTSDPNLCMLNTKFVMFKLILKHRKFLKNKNFISSSQFMLE